MKIKNDIRSRIESAADALVSQGVKNPTNEQVRQHLGGGSLSHISPVIREWRLRRREQAAMPDISVPDELRRIVTELTTRFWQQARELADADAAEVREQADADIAQADVQRDEALEEVRRLETELTLLRDVAADRDRLREQLDQQSAVLSVTRADYAALNATKEAVTRQLDDTRADLKLSREDNKAMQAELLRLARAASLKPDSVPTGTIED